MPAFRPGTRGRFGSRAAPHPSGSCSWPRVVLLCAALVGLASPALGQLGVYLDEREALSRALPGADAVHTLGRLIPQPVREAIAADAGVRYLQTRTRCYQGTRDGSVVGYACIDNMIGKERLITYVAGIAHPDGIVSLLEVMQYREAIGGEVRFPAFTGQLVGLGPEDAVRLDRDVHRISGATLSSRALTDGVRKLMALYRFYLRNLPPS